MSSGITDNNGTSVRDNSLVEIIGADGTPIGNVGDAIKVYGSTTVDSGSVGISDGANLDSFSRLRVSQPAPRFTFSFFYDTQPLLFSTLTASGGTVTHDSNKKAAVLSCTTTTNSSAKIASKKYISYYPGISHLVLLTGNFKDAATNVKKIFGQYTDDNGFFVMLNGSTLSVNVRSKISGSVVDTSVAQSSWNIDKLDGTGASGITLDLSKQQIILFDYQWLGAGRVRFGFNVDGQIIYCHQFEHANNLDVLYSQSATLPLRAEIINLGSSAATLELTCGSVIEEGISPAHGILRSVNSGTTSRAFTGTGSVLPVIALRKSSTYKEMMIEVSSVCIFGSTVDDFLVEIYLNPTLTGGSWVAADGGAEVNKTATAKTGGTLIRSFYLRASAASDSSWDAELSGSQNTVIGTNLDGTSDIFAVVLTNITSTAAAYATINYQENF